MEIGLLIFPTDKGIQPVELGREAEACRFKSLWPKPDEAHLAHLRELGASFVALALPPMDRDAALATMEKYAPLVAEFNG